MQTKIFGRDPALWSALAVSAIAAVGAFLIDLTVDQQGALNGVVAASLGIAVWIVSKDGGPALILGLVKAIISLAAAWHFNIAPDDQFVIMTLVSAITAMFIRTQIGAPVPPPTDTASPVVVVDAPTTPPQT